MAYIIIYTSYILFKYFIDYKLMTSECTSDDIHSNTTSVYNSTGNETICQETSNIYRNYFLSSLGFVAQVPNVLLNAVNVFAQVRG